MTTLLAFHRTKRTPQEDTSYIQNHSSSSKSSQSLQPSRGCKGTYLLSAAWVYPKDSFRSYATVPHVSIYVVLFSMVHACAVRCCKHHIIHSTERTTRESCPQNAIRTYSYNIPTYVSICFIITPYAYTVYSYTYMIYSYIIHVLCDRHHGITARIFGRGLHPHWPIPELWRLSVLCERRWNSREAGGAGLWHKGTCGRGTNGIPSASLCQQYFVEVPLKWLLRTLFHCNAEKGASSGLFFDSLFYCRERWWPWAKLKYMRCTVY